MVGRSSLVPLLQPSDKAHGYKSGIRYSGGGNFSNCLSCGASVGRRTLDRTTDRYFTGSDLYSRDDA